jgi:hypothetical protein
LTRIHRIANENEKEIMSPSEFRNLMGMEKGNGNYGRYFSEQVLSQKVNIDK